MDIYAEKKKMLSIYNEMSNHNLFKKATLRDKLCMFIIPVMLVTIVFALFMYGTFKDDIVCLMSLVLLVSAFLFFDKMYNNYIKYVFYLNKNKDIYYHIFVKNLMTHGIDRKKIKCYIDLLEIDGASTDNNKTGFWEYVYAIYIPGLMIYFSNVFTQDETIIFISLGLCFVPTCTLLLKTTLNRKNIKYNTILKYLKRRNLELTYE